MLKRTFNNKIIHKAPELSFRGFFVDKKLPAVCPTKNAVNHLK